MAHVQFYPNALIPLALIVLLTLAFGPLATVAMFVYGFWILTPIVCVAIATRWIRHREAGAWGRLLQLMWDVSRETH